MKFIRTADLIINLEEVKFIERYMNGNRSYLEIGLKSFFGGRLKTQMAGETYTIEEFHRLSKILVEK